jgi:hypothetical protein
MPYWLAASVRWPHGYGSTRRVLMIELYKLHWSHYVEKVRWALDFKKLEWRGIDIVAFT